MPGEGSRVDESAIRTASPGRRRGQAIALGLGVAGLGAGALLTGIRPLYVLAYALGLLLLLSWAWSAVAGRRLRLTRTLERGSPRVGEAFSETFVLSGGGRPPAPWVEVTDLGCLPGYQPGRVVSAGRAPVTWTAHGVYRRRGWACFGPVLLRTREPFGLFASERRIDGVTRVLVHPRIHPVPALGAVAGRQGPDGNRSGGWSDQPPDTGGARDHTTGDAYGRISWPLTQRHQRLMTRTFEQPLASGVWLVLDLDSAVHTGEGEDSTLEYAVRLAASVAVHVRRERGLIGLFVNDGPGTVVEPERWGRADEPILDFLALASDGVAPPLAASPLWRRLRGRPRRAVVVVTPSPDGAWSRALASAMEPGGRALAFQLDRASFGAAAGPPLEAPPGIELHRVRRGEAFQ
jgi:uncharacterized protein (DUF58 family)